MRRVELLQEMVAGFRSDCKRILEAVESEDELADDEYEYEEAGEDGYDERQELEEEDEDEDEYVPVYRGQRPE